MNELIAITTDEQGSSVVSARELHGFLEVKTKFADWIKNRIIKYRFRQDTDYVEVEGFSEFSEKGGRPTVDYALTMDMAKQLSMVENNEKGQEARLYFIEKEKQLRQLIAAPSNEQVLIQLISQSNQLMASQQRMFADQQQMLTDLRADVDSIMQGQRPPKPTRAKPPHLLDTPKKVASSLRQLISRKVNDYCAYGGYQQSETYSFLYKRLYDVYGVNVHRLNRKPGEYYLDALERYGHLDRLYSLVMAELIYLDE